MANPPKIDGTIVDYELLITAQVKVQDKDGNLFYLDPARKQGEFILRVLPQPVELVSEELPPEWVRPTKEEQQAADGKPIDWGFEQPSTETPVATEVDEEPQG